MDSNIVKIGKALKWRGVYDGSKKYYAENIITCYGGVFRCNVSVAQGIPPYELNEEGLPIMQNSETWTCLVDTSWIIEWVLAFKKFKNEAIARFETDEKHIEEHCGKLDEHQLHLESLDQSINGLKKKDEEHETAFRKFSDETNKRFTEAEKHIEDHCTQLKNHQKSIDLLNDSIKNLEEKDTEHEQMIQNLSGIISQVDSKVDKNANDIGQINEKINDSDVSLGELQKQIQQTNERINNEIIGLSETIAAQNSIIEQNGREIEILRKQIIELQEQLELMSKYNCCFGSGTWENDLYWNNESYWNNGANDDDDNEELQRELDVISYIEETGKLAISGSVIGYDEATGKLVIIDDTNTYDEKTGTLHIDDFNNEIQDEMGMVNYEEETDELEVSGSVVNYDEETGRLAIIDKMNGYDEKTSKLSLDGPL